MKNKKEKAAKERGRVTDRQTDTPTYREEKEENERDGPYRTYLSKVLRIIGKKIQRYLNTEIEIVPSL